VHRQVFAPESRKNAFRTAAKIRITFVSASIFQLFFSFFLCFLSKTEFFCTKHKVYITKPAAAFRYPLLGALRTVPPSL
jgi:hypothetical protein